MSLDALFLPLLFGYCLVSARLERTPVTAPILFALAGALAAWLWAWPSGGAEGS